MSYENRFGLGSIHNNNKSQNDKEIDMEYRVSGKTEWNVSAIGFDSWGIGGSWVRLKTPIFDLYSKFIEQKFSASGYSLRKCIIHRAERVLNRKKLKELFANRSTGDTAKEQQRGREF